MKKAQSYLFWLFLFLAIIEAKAQDSNAVKHKNLKIIREEPYGKDYLKRIVQYDKGFMRVTETVYVPKNREPVFGKFKIPEKGLVKDSVKLIVDKTKRRVFVKYGCKIVRAYKATFGPAPLMNKIMEGDRNTPEGNFKIARINPQSKYHRFLQLDYPNDSAYARFQCLKSKKAIPCNAKIGGEVGIHGIWQGGDDLIEMGVGWTDGCVAIKNKDIEELCQFVCVGTPVVIRK